MNMRPYASRCQSSCFWKACSSYCRPSLGDHWIGSRRLTSTRCSAQLRARAFQPSTSTPGAASSCSLPGFSLFLRVRGSALSKSNSLIILRFEEVHLLIRVCMRMQISRAWKPAGTVREPLLRVSICGGETFLPVEHRHPVAHCNQFYLAWPVFRANKLSVSGIGNLSSGDHLRPKHSKNWPFYDTLHPSMFSTGKLHLWEGIHKCIAFNFLRNFDYPVLHRLIVWLYCTCISTCIIESQVFEFLMFWLLGVLLALAKSLVLWIFVLLVPSLRHKFVRDSLELALDECANETGADCESRCVTPAEKERFLRSLRTDAMFALLCLRSSSHVSPLVRVDIVRELWRAYQKATEAKSAPLYPTPTGPSPTGATGYSGQQTYEMTERTRWQLLPSVTVTQESEVKA